LPTRAETAAAVASIFDRTKFPGGHPTAENAWVGVYAALLWYEDISVIPGRMSLPHLIDANRLTNAAKKEGKLHVWQQRCIDAERYIAGRSGVSPEVLPSMVDQLMKLPPYLGRQRHNIIGGAFAALLKHILETLGSQEVNYELEANGAKVFPGVELPTRTAVPFIDILVRKGKHAIGIISTKWSIRHDRINDLTSECRAYKSASTWTDTRLFYYVATNEFDPARTVKLVEDKCIRKEGGLVHVHKPLVTEVCKLNGRVQGMLDLSDLIGLTFSW